MSTVQPWLSGIPMMQQAVLLSAVRGPDGINKYHPVKMLMKFYRRGILMSAFDRCAIHDPIHPGGGSFTGPSLETGDVDDWEEGMHYLATDVLKGVDELPHHYVMHMVHAFHIIGVHHPVGRVRRFWHSVYGRFVNSFHMQPESDEEMQTRLSDRFDEWAGRDELQETPDGE
jgi:hypothetical protein